MYDTESLIMYVVEHHEQNIEQFLISRIQECVTSRNWAVQEPNVVVTDDNQFGINLIIYSAIKGVIPLKVDQQCYQDVVCILDLGKEISRNNGIQFEIDYRGECIGGISRGHLDKSLRVSLLKEWSDALKNRNAANESVT